MSHINYETRYLKWLEEQSRIVTRFNLHSNRAHFPILWNIFVLLQRFTSGHNDLLEALWRLVEQHYFSRFNWGSLPSALPLLLNISYLYLLYSWTPHYLTMNRLSVVQDPMIRRISTLSEPPLKPAVIRRISVLTRPFPQQVWAVDISCCKILYMEQTANAQLKILTQI